MTSLLADLSSAITADGGRYRFSRLTRPYVNKRSGGYRIDLWVENSSSQVPGIIGTGDTPEEAVRSAIRKVNGEW